MFALVFDSLAAYALARIDFAGRKALLVAIVATLMIPFQATLIPPVYQIVSDLGWVNTFAGLIAPRAADASGSSSCGSSSSRCRGTSTTRRGSTARPSCGCSRRSCCRTPGPR